MFAGKRPFYNTRTNTRISNRLVTRPAVVNEAPAGNASNLKSKPRWSLSLMLTLLNHPRSRHRLNKGKTKSTKSAGWAEGRRQAQSTQSSARRSNRRGMQRPSFDGT